MYPNYSYNMFFSNIFRQCTYLLGIKSTNVEIQKYVEILFEISNKTQPYIDLKLCNDYVIDEITRRIK